MPPCHDENVAMNTTTPPPPPPAFTLARNPHGRLVLTFADGTAHEGVTPVRAFPIAAPTQGLALLGQDGPTILSINPLPQLYRPPPSRSPRRPRGLRCSARTATHCCGLPGSINWPPRSARRSSKRWPCASSCRSSKKSSPSPALPPRALGKWKPTGA